MKIRTDISDRQTADIKMAILSTWRHLATILGIAAPRSDVTGSYFHRVWHLDVINHR